MIGRPERAHASSRSRCTARLTFRAAIALAYRLGQDLPDKAFTMLIDAKHGEALPDFPLGWHERAQRGYVALALQRLGLS